MFIDRPFKGGIHVCDTPEEVREVAEAMVGNTLVTSNPDILENDIMPNTDDHGYLCRCVYVLEKLEVQK